jgi:signal transduction histidine kinase
VWLQLGNRLQLAASWPDEVEPEKTPLPIPGGELPEFPEADRAFPVRHQAELLGALTLAKPPNEPVTPAEEKLLSDLASQAGLMLRNVRLTAELQARLVELRDSRQRLVTAQDEERRKLERNIHDGAQQQLVALTVKLRLLGQLAARDPAKTAEMADQLQAEATEALEDLRDLARGVYPPLLADKGLAAALESQARKSPLPVSITPDGVGRYPPEVESALYFCRLEALQNVAKYAHATHAEVRLSGRPDELAFEVIDDGDGFDPSSAKPGTGLQGMADRLDAIGGALEVRSQPGMGTKVTGRIPVRRVEA